MVETVKPSVVQIIAGRGAGSGFIIDSDGRVVTNEHVVRGFQTVTVRVAGGSSYTGKVLGVDLGADLALVEIVTSREFSPAVLGDSDSLAVGEDVIAMGFPLEDMLAGSATITRGIVSAKRVSRAGVDLIQTDAAINPGNSGGPLFGRDGAVVGVNTSKVFEAADGRAAEGIGLAVAVNEVKGRLEGLRNQGFAVATATATSVAAPTPGSGSGFRTYSRDRIELVHEDDGYIETSEVFSDIRNFTITANFEVPYAGSWDVGFLFRNSGKTDGGGNLHYVAITDSGNYSHRVRVDGESTTLDSGIVSNWDQGTGLDNRISLVVIEDRGWLFVDSKLVADLGVSSGSNAGDLEVATGMITGNEVPGESTVITDIHSEEVGILFGPADDELTKDSTFIATKRARVDVSWAYASVEIRIPDDTDAWSCGFMFRKTGEEDYLAFSITSYLWWSLDHAIYSGEDWRTLEDGFSIDIDILKPVLNRVEVFFFGDAALVYANDKLLGTADISSVSGSGDVRLAYGLYRGDDHSTAEYEGFTVWGTR